MTGPVYTEQDIADEIMRATDPGIIAELHWHYTHGKPPGWSDRLQALALTRLEQLDGR